MRRRIALAASLLVLAAIAVDAFGASSPSTLEAAKQSLASIESALTSAKSTVSSLETARSKQQTAVAALEAEQPKEEPKEGATVAATPSGPAAPTGGWHVAYADGFGAEIGTGSGQDPTWAKENGPNCCTNSTEIAAVRPSNATVTAEGLRLLMEHASYEGKSYVGAYVRGSTSSAPQISFKGETLAIQWTGTLPPNEGFADPAAWMDGAGGSAEFDFPEFIGWSSRYSGSWSGLFGYFAWFFSPHPEGVDTNVGPLEGKPHTYTVLIHPAAAGKYRYSLFIDGALFPLSYAPCFTCASAESPEVTVNANEPAHLILGYGARAPSSSLGQTHEANGTGFPNAFTVRSIAVYIDAGHAGTGAVTNEGVAPGTTVK